MTGWNATEMIYRKILLVQHHKDFSRGKGKQGTAFYLPKDSAWHKIPRTLPLYCLLEQSGPVDASGVWAQDF
jgi:hypothetical protein